MIVPDRLFAVPIIVETYSGQGAYGDQYAAPVTVLGHIGSSRVSIGGQRVKSGGEGDVIVTSLRAMVPNPARLADGSGTVDPVELLKPESRVTARAVTGTIGSVEPHIKPGTDAVVYVAAELV